MSGCFLFDVVVTVLSVSGGGTVLPWLYRAGDWGLLASRALCFVKGILIKHRSLQLWSSLLDWKDEP